MLAGRIKHFNLYLEQFAGWLQIGIRRVCCIRHILRFQSNFWLEKSSKIYLNLFISSSDVPKWKSVDTAQTSAVTNIHQNWSDIINAIHDTLCSKKCTVQNKGLINGEIIKKCSKILEMESGWRKQNSIYDCSLFQFYIKIFAKYCLNFIC